MVVLSLFDGISCGKMALEKAGISITKYYSSEIDKNAISVSEQNHTDIIRLGNIRDWRDWDIEKPDLIMGGSPCQSFSISGKREGFNSDNGQLFFEFLYVLQRYKPKFFFFENVASMSLINKDKITDYFEDYGWNTKLIKINSALVSAQTRKRYYWSNFEIEQPVEQQIQIKDVLEDPSTVDEKYYIKQKMMISNVNNKFKYSKVDKSKPIRIGSLYQNKSQGGRIYSTEGKSVCVSSGGGGLGGKTGLYRSVAIRGCYDKEGNIQQQVEIYSEKANCITGVQKDSMAYDDSSSKIRRLTPLEVERLFTLPDNYTAGYSDNMRYKLLGNGWEIATVSHCFGFLNKTIDKCKR